MHAHTHTHTHTHTHITTRRLKLCLMRSCVHPCFFLDPHLCAHSGVGKSQLVTEYVHRSYGDCYGLVIWLNAESEEDIIRSLRRLAGDAGLAVTDKMDSEVVEAVKSRLYRTRCAWLIVYDNVESPAVVERYLPRGAASGHVIVTSRRMHRGWEASSLELGCFEPVDALSFLERAAGESAGLSAPHHGLDRTDNPDESMHPAVSPRPISVTTVGMHLAERLGYLPLALAVAASYMRRCDLDAEEYLAKLDRTSTRAPHSTTTTPDYDLSLSDRYTCATPKI
jgi:hypothetical protein